MPYIPGMRKGYLNHILTCDVGENCENVGELTYILYKVCLDYLNRNTGYCYQDISEIRAALIGTLHELDRRYFDDYEDNAILRNGDVT